MIVDLSSRSTESREAYLQHQRSAASRVYVSRSLEFLDGPGVFELHIGQNYFLPGDAAKRELGDDGLKLRPGTSVVIETDESLLVPANMTGIVVGKGSLIFKGLIISPGKVDPCFSGHLLIAVFNGGAETIQIKQKEAFCNCLFLEGEAHSNIPAKANPSPRQPYSPSRWRRFLLWVDRHKATIAIVISLASLGVQVLRMVIGNDSSG